MKIQMSDLKKNTVWKMTIITIVILLCVGIWPARVLKPYHTEQYSRDLPILATGAITMDWIALQQFYPQYPVIDKIDVPVAITGYFLNDRVFVTLYDENVEIVYQEVLDFKNVHDRGCIQITPEMEFEVGKPYYIGLNVHFETISAMFAEYTAIKESQLDSFGYFAYCNEVLPGSVLCMDIYYEDVLSVGEIVLADILVVLGGACIFVLGIWLMKLLQNAGKRRIIASSTIAVLGSVACAYAFYKSCMSQYFGGALLDHIFYGVTCAVIEVALLYVCYRFVRSEENYLLKEKKWLPYLQLVTLVLLLWSCIQYTDTSYQWEQDRGRNLVMLFFGIFVFLTLKDKKQLCKKYYIILGIAGCVAGCIYAMQTGTDEHIFVNQLILAVGYVIWGLLILHTVIGYVRKKENPFKNGWNWFLLGSLAVLGISMLIFSYGKLWAILLPLMFLTYYLQGYTLAELSVYMQRFGNAVLVHYGTMVALCLLVRPIHAYRFTRYPMWFYTVACTGMYLTLVLAVALVKLFFKIKNTKRVLRGNVFEWILFASVIGFLLLSMVRTTMVALAIMLSIALLGGVWIYRPKIKHVIKIVILGGVLSLLSVVVMYTLVRCIPAVVAHPYQVGNYEKDEMEIRIGEAPNSDMYLSAGDMTQKFFDRFHLKLTVPEWLTHIDENEETTLEERIVEEKMEYYRSLGGDEEDLSNGRFEIFEDYLQHLNLYGHPSMGKDGDYELMSAHAHNSYLQCAFDFGIIAGIALLLLTIGGVAVLGIRIVRGQDRSECCWMTLMVFIGYIGTSLTEYVFNHNMPLCFAMCFALLYAMRVQSPHLGK